MYRSHYCAPTLPVITSLKFYDNHLLFSFFFLVFFFNRYAVILKIFLLYLELYVNGIMLFIFFRNLWFIHIHSYMWLLLVHSQYCQVCRFPLYEYTTVCLSYCWYIWVILVWGHHEKCCYEIFLITNEVELIFIYCAFSFMNFLFNSFAYFCVWFLAFSCLFLGILYLSQTLFLCWLYVFLPVWL